MTTSDFILQSINSFAVELKMRLTDKLTKDFKYFSDKMDVEFNLQKEF